MIEWNDPAITTEQIREIMQQTYQPKQIYLCRPDSKVYNVINGIETSTVTLSQHLRDYWVLEFDVYRQIGIDGEWYDTQCYEMLHNHMELVIPEIGYFQMHEPEIQNSGMVDEYKHVMAYSCDKELEDKDYIGLKINTGETDSREYLAENNIDEFGFAKQNVSFYYPSRPDLSLIHIALEKVPQWSVDDIDIDPLLWGVRLQVNEDSINIWALFNTIIAPKADCIFVFDIMNRKVKAYSKKRLDRNDVFDTNIFIGLRNLQKKLNVTVDENSIYTRFNVYGNDDLDIRQVNYGDPRIFDLSWYCNENYFKTQESANKVKTWQKFREDNVQLFADYQKVLANLKEEMDNIMYKVPADEDYWEQWDEMGQDQLYESLRYHTATLEMLQQSVEALDEDGNPIKILDPDGNIDHAAYLELLYAKENGYGGYYTYLETYKYIIPNILVAISNLGKIPEKKEEYIKEYETNWELYGIEELVNRRSVIEAQLEGLANYSRPWNELSMAEKASYSDSSRQYGVAGRDKYVELYNQVGYVTEDGTYYNDDEILSDGETSMPPKGTLNYQLLVLRNRYRDLETQYDLTQNEVNELVNKVSIDNPLWGFTEAEKYVINKLMIDTDYSNENIVITSLTTGATRVDSSYELYTDALNKLSEAAQPQFKFTVDLENFLEIVQFRDWIDDLKLLNFIRLGVRDDFAVKMRIIGITFNPCEKQPDLQLEFSNFISGRNGRTDVYDLLDTMMSPSKNSFTLTSSTKIDQDFATNLLKTLIQTQTFSNKVNDIISTNQLVANTAQISSLVADMISTSYIEADKIKGTSAEFEEMFSQYVNADFITTQILNADEGRFQELTTQILTFAEDSIINIAGQQITPQAIINGLANANASDFTNLDAETAFIKNILTVGEAGITQITEDTIATATINADQINVTDAFVRDVLTVGEAGITRIAEDSVTTENVIAKLVDADFGDFERLEAGSAFIQTILTVGEAGITQITEDTIATSTINADQINVTDAFVRDVLTIGTDSITTIAEGTITTEKVVAQLLEAEDADFENLTANNALVKGILRVGENGITEIASNSITTENVIAKLVEAEEGDFDQLNANSAFVRNIFQVGTDSITTIAEGVVTTEKVVAELIQANEGDFKDMTANTALIREILRVGESGITQIADDTITTDRVVTRLMEAEEADFENISADNAFLGYLQSNLIISSEIQVDDLKAKLATIDVANIEQLYANNAFVRSLQSLSSTAATSVINDAYIYNAVANKIAVADLKAGDITVSNSMRIVSDNGKMIMNGSALQILGKDSNNNDYVGVQLGYDTNDNPSLILRNEDGAVVLSPSGITEDAIADELIKNDMIKNGTISESKLNFNVMKQGDSITIEQITTGGGSFGAEYTTFKNGTNDALGDIRDGMEQLAYQVVIETPNGKNLRGGNITLNAKVYKNYVDVTSQYDPSCFTWKRHSTDPSGDATWNAAHSTGTKSLILTGNDIVMEADFECIFEVADISVSSSGSGGE